MINVDGTRIDPSAVIASQGASISAMSSMREKRTRSTGHHRMAFGDEPGAVSVRRKGFPMTQVERRFHVGAFQFSAYVKSEYIAKLRKEGTLELAEMKPGMVAVADEAQDAIKITFATGRRRKRAQWLRSGRNRRFTLTREKRQRASNKPSVRFSTLLRSPRHSICRIFQLLRRKTRPFTCVFSGRRLKRAPRAAAHPWRSVETAETQAGGAGGVAAGCIAFGHHQLGEDVADRLRFLNGIEAILFDADSKKRLKERSQLHRIVAQNCWLFGEEYNLSADDKSLTEVLRKHRKLLGDDAVIDEPVKHVSQERGIVDLMFCGPSAT